MLDAFLITMMCCVAEPVQPPALPSNARVSLGLTRPPSALRLSIEHATTEAPLARRRVPAQGRRDSVWNGALIGAGVGAAGGYFWARQLCGTNDAECFAISAPAGVLGGAGIGALIGAILDAFS